MTPLEYDNCLVREKYQYVWPLDAFPMDPTPFKIAFTYQKNFTLGPADLLECLRKKNPWTQKKKYIDCDRMWNLRRFRWDRHLPHIPKNVIPGNFSWKRKKENNKTCRGGRKVKSLSPPECEDVMVCDARSGVRLFLSMCGECDDTCVECDDACGVHRSFSSALFFEYACLERPIETANNSIPNKPRQTHQFFLHSVSHHAKISLAKPFPAHWAEIKLHTKTQVRSTMKNLVCENFLNMGMLPLEQRRTETIWWKISIYISCLEVFDVYVQ